MRGIAVIDVERYVPMQFGLRCPWGDFELTRKQCAALQYFLTYRTRHCLPRSALRNLASIETSSMRSSTTIDKSISGVGILFKAAASGAYSSARQSA
jgi:hypothetical protein